MSIKEITKLLASMQNQDDEVYQITVSVNKCSIAIEYEDDKAVEIVRAEINQMNS